MGTCFIIEVLVTDEFGFVASTNLYSCSPQKNLIWKLADTWVRKLAKYLDLKTENNLILVVSDQ